MTTESLPEHLDRPHLRPIQPLPVQKEGKTLVALHDPTRLQPQTMIVPGQVLQILQQFRGEQSLHQLAEKFEAPPEKLAELARGLDQLGLLWGPTFDKMEKERWTALEAAGAFPPRASATLGADAGACRDAIEKWFAETEDPEVEGTVLGVIAPHLDYARGWPNYAAAYWPLRGTEAPDRVVILGTNHFGLGDGVIVSELGFESPMGRCPADAAVVGRLVERLGRPLVVDQIDHLPEHSIELHLPWLQTCFGDVPIVAALMPDPIRGMIEDAETERVDPDRFIEALRDVLAEVGGRTLVVASADLSHVGPQFGEPRAVDEQRRVDVERHDREMMAKYLDADADEFIAAMKWNKNPTRWCSIGNMTAALRLVEPDAIELLDYRQAVDERGVCLVSSAAMALVRE